MEGRAPSRPINLSVLSMTHAQWHRWTGALARCILYILIIWCAVVALGFFIPMKKQFVDVSTRDQYSHSPIVEKMEADGDVLRISVVQKGVGLATIEPRIMDGDVYLDAHYISSVVRKTQFSVNLSDKRVPKDWKNRLYWIENESFSSPLYPFARDRVHEVKRRKIIIQ